MTIPFNVKVEVQGNDPGSWSLVCGRAAGFTLGPSRTTAQEPDQPEPSVVTPDRLTLYESPIENKP